MSQSTAYLGARIFDGEAFHDHAALVIENGRVAGIGAPPAEARIVQLDGGTLAPGYVDLQVNGGAGLLVGPAPPLTCRST